MRDIVSEMRNGPCCWLTPAGIPQHSHDNELFYKFAERVETAWKRELYEMDKERFMHFEREFENARLRAALKPALEVALSYEDGELINRDDGEVCTDSEYAVSVNGKPIDDHTLAGCLAAVREAQWIYNGIDESKETK